jgi:hypothetical protein
MQKVIVDSTGAWYAAGQLIRGPSARLERRAVVATKAAVTPSGVRPVLVVPGRGRAASGRPFLGGVSRSKYLDIPLISPPALAEMGVPAKSGN